MPLKLLILPCLLYLMLLLGGCNQAAMKSFSTGLANALSDGMEKREWLGSSASSPADKINDIINSSHSNFNQCLSENIGKDKYASLRENLYFRRDPPPPPEYLDNTGKPSAEEKQLIRQLVKDIYPCYADLIAQAKNAGPEVHHAAMNRYSNMIKLADSAKPSSATWGRLNRRIQDMGIKADNEMLAAIDKAKSRMPVQSASDRAERLAAYNQYKAEKDREENTERRHREMMDELRSQKTQLPYPSSITCRSYPALGMTTCD